MWIIGPVGFTAPWLLLGLLALPVLWFVLRAVPPAPVRRRFPGITLLLGLRDDAHQTDRTPWWLLLLRILAIAALIIGFAGPVLNPQVQASRSGPLLILADGTWADAPSWTIRTTRIAQALEEAGRSGRAVAVVLLTDPPAQAPAFQSADLWATRLPGLTPRPHAPDPAAMDHFAATLPAGAFDTFWLSDGLDRASRAPLLAALEARGSVRVFEGGRATLALRPARFEEGEVRLTALRARAGGADQAVIVAHGPDPLGIERELARAPITFEAGETTAETALVLPGELRNRITRFQIGGFQNGGLRSAGAVALTDDALKRRKVALVSGRADREGLDLLSPLFYLHQALAPTSDLIEGADIAQLLPAAPDVVVLADVAQLAQADADALTDWVGAGGMLVRFAGPRLAASDVARDAADPLLPVRLRAGGRSVGGAMSWGAPKSLRAFGDGSPFFGLDIPDDVQVSAQVLAQPDPDLANRTIAALQDGTPLVTRSRLGQGQVVLFHVTANAEWSSLPLSGLFVQMLERLAVSTRPGAPVADDIEGRVWVPVRRIDGFGTVSKATDLPGVEGADLAAALTGSGASAGVPPGVYASGARQIALNVIGADRVLAPARWPDWVVVEGLSAAREAPLKGWFLAAALLALIVDIVASLALGGLLGRRVAGTAALLLLALAAGVPAPGTAQGTQTADAFALRATSKVVLAHVLTGDVALDRISQAGLRGLSAHLFQRTAVEPGEAIGVDLERDELAFFPLLYWPVTPSQPQPSDQAYARLNAYLRNGGMIVFDTRDADIAGFGAASANGRKLQQLAAPLDIPPLEPVPSDHVLTRTFYLLSDFPGRFMGRDVWVEAAPPDAERAEGMPFRNLNDGVTPVVIGGNDWAAAWALDERGQPVLPVGRGFAGNRQREMAVRFGINLVMHVLTGNYKSDQVHVPALLDRLGQ
ncbi:MAG: DUF4159 domain-containing protein [Rhodobacteraceae bacterium]|nr:DUF4159 domain-containing protein [Paracoccaceae bacterium]